MRADVMLMTQDTRPVAVAGACTVTTADASSSHATTLYFFYITTSNSSSCNMVLIHSPDGAYVYGSRGGEFEEVGLM